MSAPIMPELLPPQGYFTQAQVDKLLEPVNPGRVSKLKKAGREFSYMEAYELRAALNRLLGFGRWSEDVLVQEPLYESDKDGKWTVGYRSLVRLTVCAPDGTVLCTYTEGGTGEAINQPGRGDAHNLALKTSQSDAFKRCCVNFGDYGGVSLYGGGSTRALVAKTLHYPFDGAPQSTLSLDTHVEQVVPEADPEHEAVPEPAYETNGHPAPSEPTDDEALAVAERWRALILAPLPPGEKPAKHYALIMKNAMHDRALALPVADENGETVTVGALINARLAQVSA